MRININLSFGIVTPRMEDVKMDKMDEFSELMKDERDIENKIKKLHREIDALEFQRVMIARRSSKILVMFTLMV